MPESSRKIEIVEGRLLLFFFFWRQAVVTWWSGLAVVVFQEVFVKNRDVS